MGAVLAGWRTDKPGRGGAPKPNRRLVWQLAVTPDLPVTHLFPFKREIRTGGEDLFGFLQAIFVVLGVRSSGAIVVHGQSK